MTSLPLFLYRELGVEYLPAAGIDVFSVPKYLEKPPNGALRNLKSLVEELVNALPSAWLELPVTDEVFPLFEECEERLRGYSLSRALTS